VPRSRFWLAGTIYTIGEARSAPTQCLGLLRGRNMAQVSFLLTLRMVG
jgi:hypothetical protein